MQARQAVACSLRALLESGAHRAPSLSSTQKMAAEHLSGQARVIPPGLEPDLDLFQAMAAAAKAQQRRMAPEREQLAAAGVHQEQASAVAPFRPS